MTFNMNNANLLYVTNRDEWRSWLVENYKTEKQVWLVFYKKHTGKPGVTYNDTVEEALCFGWIDSIVRRIDQDRYAQRFSVRKPKSSYSQANKKRLKKMVEQGRVVEDVLETPGEVLNEEFEIPADILQTIKVNPRAWENFKPSHTCVH
jgi:uncharacterized protein YdeI (YjbR/CyaY-like superfamily)